jgi:hypothetical protein
MADWRIERKRELCGGCERPFEEGGVVFSILTLGPEGLGRADRCQPCFRDREIPAEGGPSEELAFWRTRWNAAKRKGLVVDFEAVEALFLATDGRDEPRLLELRFLLCLLLLRKRRLKLVRVRRSQDSEDMILRRPRRQEELRCVVVDLDAERIAERRKDLSGILEGAALDEVLAAPAPERAVEEPESNGSEAPSAPAEA